MAKSIRSLFVEINMLDKTTKPIRKLNTDFNNAKKQIVKNSEQIQKSLMRVGAALTAVAAAGGIFYKSALKDLSRYEDGMVTFGKLAGSNADQMIIDMDRAAGGAVEATDMILAANKAMIMGIDPGAITRMMEISRAAARATGEDVSMMFESITMGTARQSRLILDNLGIIVSIEEANEKYAESIGTTVQQLSDEEKQLAFQLLVMEKGQVIINTTDLSQKSLNEELQVANVRWKELRREIAKGALPVIMRTLDVLGYVLDVFKALPAPVKTTLGTIGILITIIAAILGPLALMAASLLYVHAQLAIAGITIPVVTGALMGLATAVWAVLAPLLPFIAAGALVALIIQDFIVGLKGGESTVFKFADWLIDITGLADKVGVTINWMTSGFKKLENGLDAAGSAINEVPLLKFLKNIITFTNPILTVVWAFRHWKEIPTIIGNALSAIPSRLKGFGAVFKDAGKFLIDTFIQGMTFGLLDTDKLTKVFSGIRDYLPFSDAKVGPLSDLTLSGQKFMQTFAAGAETQTGLVGGLLSMPNTIGRAAEAIGATNVNVYISDVKLSGDDTTLQKFGEVTVAAVEKAIGKINQKQAIAAGF